MPCSLADGNERFEKNFLLPATGLNFDELKSGGLHEKHAVATRNLGTTSTFLKDRGKLRKPVSRSPATGLSGSILTSLSLHTEY
jgi:hypothetical protein